MMLHELLQSKQVQSYFNSRKRRPIQESKQITVMISCSKCSQLFFFWSITHMAININENLGLLLLALPQTNNQQWKELAVSKLDLVDTKPTLENANECTAWTAHLTICAGFNLTRSQIWVICVVLVLTLFIRLKKIGTNRLGQSKTIQNRNT